MSSPSVLLPEWVDVDAIMLAWPHAKTDWAPWLEDARQTYLNVIQAVNNASAGVILICQQADIEDVQARLPQSARVLIVPAVYNDTWMRDYGFLTLQGEPGQANQPVEFQFNGWGNKFFAADDNQVNQRYLASLCQLPVGTSPVVAEGGALEIDAQGHLLTTAQCLLNPERNGDMDLETYSEVFKGMLGCSKVSVFHHGHLEGDDTDGHVDTLVRYTPDNGLVIQAGFNRPDDSHFEGLKALCDECAESLPDHRQFHLPLPEIFNADGDRLPASYANYLICNHQVLVPVYNQAEDVEALTVIKQAYPDFTVVAVDCSVLVRQYGSLHCISMQVPTNTLTHDVVTTLQKGVSIYATQHA